MQHINILQNKPISEKQSTRYGWWLTIKISFNSFWPNSNAQQELSNSQAIDSDASNSAQAQSATCTTVLSLPTNPGAEWFAA